VLRIAQLATFHGRAAGGSNTVLETLGRSYLEAGHERILVVPGPDDRDELTPTGRVITIRGVPLPGGFHALGERRRVRELIEDLAPTSLEIGDKLMLAGLGGWVRRHRIPAVLVGHERIDALFDERLPVWVPLPVAADLRNRRLTRWVDRVVCPSRYAQAQFEASGAVDVTVVPLGTDLELFTPERRQPGVGPLRLVLVSRLTRSKRPELAIDALAELRARGVDAALTVIGTGPAHTALRAHAGGLPVEFLGHIDDRRALATLVASADVLLAPCPVEAFGLAVLDGLACGVPAVVIEGTGAAEVVGPAGVAVAPTAGGLADGALELTGRPVADRRAAARQRAEHFPWRSMVQAMVALHRDLAARLVPGV
jgi:alpha-1,6-mannosyltransferase